MGFRHRASRSTKRTAWTRSIRRPDLELDPELLARFPTATATSPICRRQIGYKVKKTMPGLKGPEVEELYAKGKKWLAGEPV